jgi:GDP-mannose 6-dehydrogenase
LVGLSFKAQTDDLRESPLVDLAERLLGKGFSVHVYDPIVRLSRLTGANKSFLCERLPHIRSILLEDADELVRCSDTLVLGNSYAAEDVLTKRGASEKVIVDLVRTRLDCEVGEKYNGICW